MATPPVPQFDPGAEMHPADLYRPEGTAFGVDTFPDIGEREIAHYREQGYLVVRRAFPEPKIAEAREGLIDLIMGRNPDFTTISFEAGARENLDRLGPEARQDAVRKLMFFVDHEPRLRAISHDPSLLGVVRTLLDGAKPTMFQDMALLKPPRMGREKPWHQDKAYFNYPVATPVVGVWIALDEATIENGCMQLLPGLHNAGPILHFQRRDWQICDTEILGRRSVAAPLQPGGLLMFNGMLPHGTPHNASSRRRRALQFHYAPADIAPLNTDDERLKHFGSEGKNVSC